MLKAVTITNPASNDYELVLSDPWSSGINIVNIDGLGPPVADLYMAENAFYDGARYIASRAQKRTITFTVKFVDMPGVRTIQDCRRLTYEIFPIKQRIRMWFNTEDVIYEIYGYVESNTPNIFSDAEGAVISVVCPFPYFQNVNEGESIGLDFTPYVGQFVFPFYRMPEDPDPGKQIIFSERVRPMYNIVDNSTGIETGCLIHIQFMNSVVPTNVYPVLHIASLDNSTYTYNVDLVPSDKDNYVLNFGNTGSTWSTDVIYAVNTIRGSRGASTISLDQDDIIEDYTLTAYNSGSLEFSLPTGKFALFLDFKPSSISDSDYFKYLQATTVHIEYPNLAQGI